VYDGPVTLSPRLLAATLCLASVLASCRAEPAPVASPAAAAPEVPSGSFAASASTGAGAGEAPAAAEASALPAPELGAAATPARTATEPGASSDASVQPPPAATRPFKVLVLGDSLAATGFGALLEKQLDAHPGIQATRKARSASGLARPDFFDWPAEARRQVEARQPDLVVVILGGNDGQDLAPRKGDKKGSVRWETPAWEHAYAQRMADFLEILRGPEGRRVLWLGLPRTGTKLFEKKLDVIRRVQQAAVAAQPQARYVDTSPLLQAEDGSLLREAPVGVRRRVQVLREEDGIHFTMGGSEYFADRVVPEILEFLGLEPAVAGAKN
jgi:hypothetical protein